MRRLFGMKTEDTPEDVGGNVIGRVTVEKVSRYENKVTAYLVERSTGETVYHTSYKTIDPELHAYYKASDELKRYIKYEDLFLDGTVSTNVELPFLKNANKTGYAR